MNFAARRAVILLEEALEREQLVVDREEVAVRVGKRRRVRGRDQVERDRQGPAHVDPAHVVVPLVERGLVVHGRGRCVAVGVDRLAIRPLKQVYVGFNQTEQFVGFTRREKQDKGFLLRVLDVTPAQGFVKLLL